MNSRGLRGLLLILLLGVISSPAQALLNPAAVYCEACGYNYTIELTEYGERGICQLPDGQAVDAWEFLQGKVAQEYSYCSKVGYGIKTVRDDEKCLKFLTDECAVCILPNGTEIEVTELMGLNFEETMCGDGTCGFPENFKTCPEDCPSGGMDGYCDGIADGICDPECEKDEDPDCQPATTNFWLMILGVIAIVIVVSAILLWKRKEGRKRSGGG